MNTETFLAREVYIPLDQYPHIYADEPIGNGVALLLQNISADGRHLHYEDILVLNRDDRVAGHLSIQDILTSFFPSILTTATPGVFEGKMQHFTDLSILLEDSFQRECRRQSAHTINMYMTQPHQAIDASMHLLHVLEIMIKDQETLLPVEENGVLLGAVRMEDVFKILGTYCTI